MAIKVKLVKNGKEKNGYVGFSYTTFLFNFFVPLSRQDYMTAIEYFGMDLIIIPIITLIFRLCLYIISLCINSEILLSVFIKFGFIKLLYIVIIGIFYFIVLIVPIWMGFIYNKEYTKKLLNEGFLPSDEDSFAYLCVHKYINIPLPNNVYETYKKKYMGLEYAKILITLIMIIGLYIMEILLNYPLFNFIFNILYKFDILYK